MDILKAYAMQFVGTPYRWGGDDPMAGFDCSGFVQELLASCGLDPKGDDTAQGLFNFFDRHGEKNPSPGMGVLVFYGESLSKIVHVAMMLDEFRIIEAGGGGYKTLTEQDAIKQNAYIRIRHLSNRKPIAMLRPNYSTIGVPFLGR
ncbi:MAG: C40 family peptidase [Spirulinaceae cyanobacterium RM2_2_10]|nr:C40 family peptidase [Spirulinaceae cyanobacterium RM2_2_10]